jgi:hypothetical protein
MWDWFAVRNTTVSYCHSSLQHHRTDLIRLACLGRFFSIIFNQVADSFDINCACSLETCRQRFFSLIAPWAWTHRGPSNVNHRSHGQVGNRLEIWSSWMMQVRNLPTIIFLYDCTLSMSSWRGPQTSTIRLYDQVVNRFEVCSSSMVQVRNLPTNHFLQDLNVAYHSTMTVVYRGNIELPVSSNTQYMWWYLLLT